MNCLKCGKKTTDDQCFCPECLDSMDAYPVRPDVHIQLPSRATQPVPTKAGRKRRTLAPEEQVALLRRRVRRLTVLTVVLAVLLCVAGALLLRAANSQALPELGKNYTFNNPFD